MSNREATRRLFSAIEGNNIEQAAAALDAGADIEAELGYRGKPLGWAASLGHVEVAALLLDRGAQVNGTNQHAQTALLCASQRGYIQVAELLVSRGAGASLEVADQFGVTPLLRALKHGKHEMATWLLDQGATMYAVADRRQTVLHLAVSRYPDFARLLQDANVAAMVDAKDTWDGTTALHHAAGKGHLDHVRLLLDAGATVDVTERDQRTPLHLASREGHVEVMRELVQRGAHVDAVDKGGSTPLTRSSTRQAARLLLEFGADRSFRNNRGKTARDVAVARGRVQVVEVLDTYFPVKLQLEQMLLGLRSPSDSPLTRFAQHNAFEPKVLSIVAAFHSGKSTPAFAQLQREAAGQGRGGGGGGDEASS